MGGRISLKQMKYRDIFEAEFIDRPNRFIANVIIDGQSAVCHVKNTGRCKELLIPGVKVCVQRALKPERKTQWDLIAVMKGDRLINIDSAAPNAVFGEWLRAGGLTGAMPELIRPETVYKSSRFDFYFEQLGKKAFAEVKGVTLEEDGVVLFPDAPTERGVKHLHGLIDCVQDGYEAYAVFIVQMKGVKYFTPNRATHPEFADALKAAQDAGVNILALDCAVKPDEIRVCDRVKILL